MNPMCRVSTSDLGYIEMNTIKEQGYTELGGKAVTLILQCQIFP